MNEFIILSFFFKGLPDGKGSPSGVIGTLKKLKAGYLAGTRVITGKIQDFLSTSCIVRLHFLETGTQVEKQSKKSAFYLCEVCKFSFINWFGIFGHWKEFEEVEKELDKRLDKIR